MGKTAQRKRSAFELGVAHAKKYGRGWNSPYMRGPILTSYTNGVKAGLSPLVPSYSPDYADGCDFGALAFEHDINMGLWTGLKRLALLAALVLVALILFGCSTRTIIITPDGINATPSSFLYCPEATVTRISDGSQTADMVGETSGVGAVVTEALKP